ncbi:MAG: glycosyltransferase family 4 protein [Deltaproteobacteria bacterium]|nr:glycosyltransferase family 4 protein [Deltaproteobacteria bacterium]
MTGLLTGIARYLRNLYCAMNLIEQPYLSNQDLSNSGISNLELSYFQGKIAVNSMPPMAESEQCQIATKSVRKLPDPVIFGIRAARWLKYEYNLNKLCKKKTFNIYHETAYTPAKLTSIPTVYSIYDLSLRRYSETHPRERVWFFEYFIKTRLKYARHILTISEFIKQEIIDEFKVSPSMVTAVPLAPDPLFGLCTADIVKKTKIKYNLPETYLLFVSSLEPRKNIDLLIKALQTANTDIPLVLVGWHGWGDKKWLEKIKQPALKKRIYITGHLPDDDLKAIYNGAQALVYPSLYEGFGLPIIEAMACGCPVICSDAASMPEVAGDAAILIDPAKSDELAFAIETIVHDTEIKNNLVKKGFKQAAGFTWDSTARKTLEIFKMVAR